MNGIAKHCGYTGVSLSSNSFCFLIWWSISVHLYYYITLVLLSVIGSVMRCHKIRLIWRRADLCQMLPASFSFCLSNTHSNTRYWFWEHSGEDMWSFVSVSHLQCTSITVLALVKVNTTPSLWQIDTCSQSLSVHIHTSLLFVQPK